MSQLNYRHPQTAVIFFNPGRTAGFRLRELQAFTAVQVIELPTVWKSAEPTATLLCPAGKSSGEI